MIGDSVQFITRHAESVYDAEHFFDGIQGQPEYACNAHSRGRVRWSQMGRPLRQQTAAPCPKRLRKS